jgi:hypothetical protein
MPSSTILPSFPSFQTFHHNNAMALFHVSLKELTNYPILHLLATSFVFYLAGLAVYRLLLSPIAGFPGPKLAALTQWYECYYNVILPGQFFLHIEALHDKYGMLSSRCISANA